MIKNPIQSTGWGYGGYLHLGGSGADSGDGGEDGCACSRRVRDCSMPRLTSPRNSGYVDCLIKSGNESIIMKGFDSQERSIVGGSDDDVRFLDQKRIGWAMWARQ